jgi:dTDP-4-amino-4,6-dideoxygalactose transaminase
VIAAATQENGNFFPLPEENDFQDALAKHEGAKKAIAVNACGTALDLCMMVLGVGAGDEVITTPLTFVCTATCASARGAKVVFADVDERTLCLDPKRVREKITPRTKAIIPVHFAGLAADIDGFDAITRDTGVPVIYDAAHAVGTRYRGEPIGGAGMAACYSFQSNKNMTTLGEGGAVITDDETFAEQVRRKKTFGYVYGSQGVRVVTQGFNYRLTKPQLAVGLTQLAKIDRVNALKREKARRLHRQLEGTAGLILPAGIDDDGHAMHLYIVRVTDVDRDTFRKHLKERYGVATAVHYPAVWTWEAFENDAIDYDREGCDIAARACGQVVSLPVFPKSSDEDIDYTAYAVKRTLEDLSR